MWFFLQKSKECAALERKGTPSSFLLIGQTCKLWWEVLLWWAFVRKRQNPDPVRWIAFLIYTVGRRLLASASFHSLRHSVRSIAEEHFQDSQNRDAKDRLLSKSPEQTKKKWVTNETRTRKEENRNPQQKFVSLWGKKRNGKNRWDTKKKKKLAKIEFSRYWNSLHRHDQIWQKIQFGHLWFVFHCLEKMETKGFNSTKRKNEKKREKPEKKKKKEKFGWSKPEWKPQTWVSSPNCELSRWSLGDFGHTLCRRKVRESTTKTSRQEASMNHQSFCQSAFPAIWEMADWSCRFLQCWRIWVWYALQKRFDRECQPS